MPGPIELPPWLAAAALLLAWPAGAAAADPSPYRLHLPPGEYRLRSGGPVASVGRAHPPAGMAALIERQATARGLDPALVHAVIQAESGYRADAVSAKGAVGLMQVMPATGRRFGVADLDNPEANLRAGTAYLGHLLARYDLPLALAAYNAGEGAVLRHGGAIPPYPETRAYVAGVLRAYRRPSPFSFYLDGTRLEAGSLADYRLHLPRGR